MKIGIIGLSLSGKTELFEALTGAPAVPGGGHSGNEERKAVVKVPDERLERLAVLFKPEKKTPAGIEYIDFAGLEVSEEKREGFSNKFLGNARTADALLVVVRAFADDRIPHPLKSLDPVRDVRSVEIEFIISDLAIIESRIERLGKQMKSQKNPRDVAEVKVLERCKKALEEETPLRLVAFDKDEEMLIRGFRFLTQKPLIIAVNIGESDIPRAAEIRAGFAAWAEKENSEVLCLSARLEREIGQLSAEEACVFLQDFCISHPAREQLITISYKLLGLISFFTVGPDEVKAWTIKSDTKAAQAAGVIHSDIERGFIRAEVVAYQEFLPRESWARCKNEGVLRLEGREYTISDGDVVNFRFAV